MTNETNAIISINYYNFDIVNMLIMQCLIRNLDMDIKQKILDIIEKLLSSYVCKKFTYKGMVNSIELMVFLRIKLDERND